MDVLDTYALSKSKGETSEVNERPLLANLLNEGTDRRAAELIRLARADAQGKERGR